MFEYVNNTDFKVSCRFILFLCKRLVPIISVRVQRKSVLQPSGKL